MSIADFSHNRAEAIRLIRKAKRGEARAKAITKFIGQFIAAAALILLRGAVLMVLVDVIHRMWIPAVPPLGFLAAMFIMIAVRVIIVELFKRPLVNTSTNTATTNTKETHA